MPFGICSASDIAKGMVEEHFVDIDGVLAEYDDITIAGKDNDELTSSLDKYSTAQERVT